MGSIAFCPLEQGLLTGKYCSGIPEGSRAAGNSVILGASRLSQLQENVKALDQMEFNENELNQIEAILR